MQYHSVRQKTLNIRCDRPDMTITFISDAKNNTITGKTWDWNVIIFYIMVKYDEMPCKYVHVCLLSYTLFIVIVCSYAHGPLAYCIE